MAGENKWADPRPKMEVMMHTTETIEAAARQMGAKESVMAEESSPIQDQFRTMEHLIETVNEELYWLSNQLRPVLLPEMDEEETNKRAEPTNNRRTPLEDQLREMNYGLGSTLERVRRLKGRVEL